MPNVRVALRSLLRAPGFSITATLTLALGIGLSTAMFTVADALLLRRLPVRDQNRLIGVWGETADGRFKNFPLSLREAREFARRTRSLQQIGFVDYNGAWPRPIRDGDLIYRLRQGQVSGNYFDVLGARAVIGRPLRAEDDVVGAAPVMVLSFGAWQGRFGGDSAVIGRRVLLHDVGITYTVVGVMPQGLDYPLHTEFWIPIVPATTHGTADSSSTAAIHIVARLAPNATPAAPRAEMTAYFRRPAAEPYQRAVRGITHMLPDLILGDVKPALFVFSAAVALLLLISCINVANLLLVRGLGRVREIAVRSALGASRLQVVGQLLTESAMLAAIGGVLGVGIGAAAVRVLVALAPPQLPRIDEIGMNSAALGAAIAITCTAMLCFALAPAIVTARVPLQQVLRAGTRQSGGSRRFRLATETLVVGQMALALVVLSAAALIGRSFLNLQSANLGFEASRLLVVELAVRYDQYSDVRKQVGLLDLLVPRLAAVPGVRGVSPAVAGPFSGTAGWDGVPVAEGQRPEDIPTNPYLNMEVVTPNYFTTLGMTVLRGRSFTAEDREGATPVIMVSQSTARLFWPGQDPIGKRLGEPGRDPHWMRVIGVVPDTRYRDLREARASIYYPLAQSRFPYAPMTLVIRTDGAPSALVPAIRRAIAETSPNVALATATPFTTLMDGPRAQPRLNAVLLGVFATASVALAAIGLFGVMATMVRLRTRELGVRMALGATSADLRSMVLRRGLVLGSVGTLAGLAGALAVGRLLSSVLFGVAPGDPSTLAAVTLLLLAVATLASLIPARTSSRVDPVIALRADG
jgi:putative ABC transport system permease protein